METDTTIKLYAALSRLGRQLHRYAPRSDFAGTYFRGKSRILQFIAEHDGVIQRDLAEEMDVRPSSMTEMLLKMERVGLITREQDTGDQRVMHIHITEQGRAMVEAARRTEPKIADSAFDVLTDDEREELLRLTECGQCRGHHRGFERDRDWYDRRRGQGHMHHHKWAGPEICAESF